MLIAGWSGLKQHSSLRATQRSLRRLHKQTKMKVAEHTSSVGIKGHRCSQGWLWMHLKTVFVYKHVSDFRGLTQPPFAHPRVPVATLLSPTVLAGPAGDNNTSSSLPCLELLCSFHLQQLALAEASCYPHTGDPKILVINTEPKS